MPFPFFKRKVSDREILIQVLKNTEIIMNDLSKLTAAVTANTAATQAAVAAITGATDQPAIDALTAQIEANTAALNGAASPAVPTPATPAA